MVQDDRSISAIQLDRLDQGCKQQQQQVRTGHRKSNNAQGFAGDAPCPIQFLACGLQVADGAAGQLMLREQLNGLDDGFDVCPEVISEAVGKTSSKWLS